MVLDLLLMTSLGFLGSFGHCASMCGPLTVALAVSRPGRQALAGTSSAQGLEQDPGGGSPGQRANPGMSHGLGFHFWLNLGRLLSYGLVGLTLGAVGEVLVASGQMAGLGSELRRGMATASGLLLIVLGLRQIAPQLLPSGFSAVPGWGSSWGQRYRDRLGRILVSLSLQEQRWTPLLLGLCWGLIPCGFLYIAQLRAAETGSWWTGGLLMLAFGLGTAPTMLGLGWIASHWSRERRSQLFRLGGWVTLATGGLLLLRSGDSHGGGLSAYGGLLLLMLALLARPLALLGQQRERPELGYLLPYRRGLGVGAFVLVLLHVAHVYSVNWDWNWQVLAFLLPRHRQSVALGLGALGLMLPAALTSFDRYQKGWPLWRPVHLLTLPALLLAVVHTLLIATAYRLPGSNQGSWWATGALGGAAGAVLLLRALYPPRSRDQREA